MTINRPGPNHIGPATVRLFCEVTFAGAAVPVLTSKKHPGIVSIARNGVGDHTLTLADKWQDCVSITLQMKTAAADVANATTVQCVMYDESDLDAATPTLRFATCATAGVPADIADTEKGIYIIEMQKSSDFAR